MLAKGDMIDVVVKLVTFLSFVVFGIAVWTIKRETQGKHKKKRADEKE